LGNEQNNKMAQIGLPEATLLQRLVNLPFQYFSGPRGRRILLPTLIILCQDKRNVIIMEDHLDRSFLTLFVEELKDLLPKALIEDTKVRLAK
jgi:hypothetical protein